MVREEQERTKAMAEQKRMTDRFASTLVISASIIAAVRLARDQDISRPSPRLGVYSFERGSYPTTNLKPLS